MKQGALAALGSVAQVAAFPKPGSLWHRLDDILEQRQAGGQASSVATQSSSATAPPSYNAGPPAITNVQTALGAALAATTAGPSPSLQASTSISSDVFVSSRTRAPGDVCLVSLLREYSFITVFATVTSTVSVTAARSSGSPSSSAASFGNGTASATPSSLQPPYSLHNGTASFPSRGGPTGAAAASAASSSPVILGTGAADASVVLPSRTGLHANSTTSTFSATSTSGTLVIATTLTPTITAPVVSAAVPTVTAAVTATVTGPGVGRHWRHHRGAGGRPTAARAYCGVHGARLGVFYQGTFTENQDNMPITLEGCRQFCSLTTRAAAGCQSYYFHVRADLPGSYACDLYGSRVGNVLARLNDDITGAWYDLGCGPA